MGVVLVIAALLIWSLVPEKATPCVYSHNWFIDLLPGKTGQRTCSQLLDEANARISAQQTVINNLAKDYKEAPTLTGDPLPSEM
jgi:hypothetical protein